MRKFTLLLIFMLGYISLSANENPTCWYPTKGEITFSVPHKPCHYVLTKNGTSTTSGHIPNSNDGEISFGGLTEGSYSIKFTWTEYTTDSDGNVQAHPKSHTDGASLSKEDDGAPTASKYDDPTCWEPTKGKIVLSNIKKSTYIRVFRNGQPVGSLTYNRNPDENGKVRYTNLEEGVYTFTVDGYTCPHNLSVTLAKVDDGKT